MPRNFGVRPAHHEPPVTRGRLRADLGPILDQQRRCCGVRNRYVV